MTSPGVVGPRILLEVRKYLYRRFGGLKAPRQSFVHVAKEVSQANDFPLSRTQEIFTDAPKLIPTSPEM